MLTWVRSVSARPTERWWPATTRRASASSSITSPRPSIASGPASLTPSPSTRSSISTTAPRASCGSSAGWAAGALGSNYRSRLARHGRPGQADGLVAARRSTRARGREAVVRCASATVRHRSPGPQRRSISVSAQDASRESAAASCAISRRCWLLPCPSCPGKGILGHASGSEWSYSSSFLGSENPGRYEDRVHP